jgi:hypothetical protein
MVKSLAKAAVFYILMHMMESGNMHRCQQVASLCCQCQCQCQALARDTDPCCVHATAPAMNEQAVSMHAMHVWYNSVNTSLRHMAMAMGYMGQLPATCPPVSVHASPAPTPTPYVPRSLNSMHPHD